MSILRRTPVQIAKGTCPKRLWLTICATLILILAGCGSRVKASPVTTSPPISCLKLEIANKEVEGVFMNPILSGSNDCTQPLTISIKRPAKKTYQFQPGEEVHITIDDGEAPFVDHSARSDFKLPAQVGEEKITISFYTVSEDDFFSLAPLGLLFGMGLLSGLGLMIVLGLGLILWGLLRRRRAQ